MTKRTVNLIFSCMLALALTGCAIETGYVGAAPEPTPEITAEGVPEIAAEAAADSMLEAVAETVPDAVSDEATAFSSEIDPEPAAAASSDHASDERLIIIDTDTGADDASALIYAAMQSNVRILGVTVLVGNVDLEQGTKNALMALEMAGCDAPVFKGAADTYDGVNKVAFSVFGTDGMGDADLIHPKRTAEEQDAVEFILNTIKENPGRVEIVALGPATNIAKAIDRDPETMKDVRMIWSMGTAGLGPGNASPVAEFNVFADAKAYKRMLDSGLPITIVGLDVCDGDAQWTDECFKRLNEAGEPGAFVAASFEKIRDFYRGNGLEYVENCDALAMMCVLCPEFVNETIKAHASCIIDDQQETYAQVLFYREGFPYDMAANDYEYNVELVTNVDQADFFNSYLSGITNGQQDSCS